MTAPDCSCSIGATGASNSQAMRLIGVAGKIRELLFPGVKLYDPFVGSKIVLLTLILTCDS
jgi:hypothetical protein